MPQVSTVRRTTARLKSLNIISTKGKSRSGLGHVQKMWQRVMFSWYPYVIYVRVALLRTVVLSKFMPTHNVINDCLFEEMFIR